MGETSLKYEHGWVYDIDVKRPTLFEFLIEKHLLVVETYSGNLYYNSIEGFIKDWAIKLSSPNYNVNEGFQFGDSLFKCLVCGKGYNSEKAYIGHLGSKANIELGCTYEPKDNSAFPKGIFRKGNMQIVSRSSIK